MENKIIKSSILLVLLVGALLFVYFNYWGIENAPNRYSGYNPPTFFGVVIAIPFFPAGLLNLFSFFQSRPDNDYAGIVPLLISPFLWTIYIYLGAKYISLQRPESYKFLGIFALVLVLNINGCNGMGL